MKTLTSVQEVEDEGDASDWIIDILSDIVPVIEYARQNGADTVEAEGGGFDLWLKL